MFGKDNNNTKQKLELDRRIFFIGATFGKYMQFYAEANGDIVDDSVIESAVRSTHEELIDWYRTHGLSESDQDLIVNYIMMVQQRMYELWPEEAEKLK